MRSLLTSWLENYIGRMRDWTKLKDAIWMESTERFIHTSSCVLLNCIMRASGILWWLFLQSLVIDLPSWFSLDEDYIKCFGITSSSSDVKHFEVRSSFYSTWWSVIKLISSDQYHLPTEPCMQFSVFLLMSYWFLGFLLLKRRWLEDGPPGIWDDCRFLSEGMILPLWAIQHILLDCLYWAIRFSSLIGSTTQLLRSTSSLVVKLDHFEQILPSNRWVSSPWTVYQINVF